MKKKEVMKSKQTWKLTRTFIFIYIFLRLHDPSSGSRWRVTPILSHLALLVTKAALPTSERPLGYSVKWLYRLMRYNFRSRRHSLCHLCSLEAFPLGSPLLHSWFLPLVSAEINYWMYISHTHLFNQWLARILIFFLEHANFLQCIKIFLNLQVLVPLS